DQPSLVGTTPGRGAGPMSLLFQTQCRAVQALPELPQAKAGLDAAVARVAGLACRWFGQATHGSTSAPQAQRSRQTFSQIIPTAMASPKKTVKPAKKAKSSAKEQKKAAKRAGKAGKDGAVSQQLAAQRRAIENGLCPSCFKRNRTSFKLCQACRK